MSALFRLLNYQLLLFIIGCCVACSSLPKNDQLDAAKYHHRLAYGHFIENRDSEAALQEILKSIKLNSKVPEVHMLTGLIYTGRRDLLKALKHYRMAIELKPDYYEAKNNLGTVYLSLSMWNKAIEVFTELTGKDEYRTPAMGYNNLGWAYYNLGKIKLAQKNFITSTQLNPRLCPPHNNVGMIYLKLNDLERAIRSLKAVIEQCPQYAEPHLHLGRVYMQKSDQQNAFKAWETCYKLSPNNDTGLRCRRLSAQLQSP